MGKKKQQIEEVPHDEIHDALAEVNAKTMFIEGSIDMGVRLAAGFLLPILGGIWLDNTFNMSPSATIAGFMIAVVLSSMVVYSSVKEANERVAQMDAQEQSTKEELEVKDKTNVT